MLTASSTRDLNQSARAAAKFLQEELGAQLSHSKALELVARMVGMPNHMAAQARLPSGHGTLDSQRSMLPVLQDLVRLLAHPDLDEPVYRQGLSDAVNGALASAAAFLPSECLSWLSKDVLQEAYDELPIDVPAMQLTGQNAGARAAPEQVRLAIALATALRAWSKPSEDVQRIVAQYEMATGTSGSRVYRLVQAFGLSETVVRLNSEQSLQLSIGDYVIASDSEAGFWCNDFGWVAQKKAATGFKANPSEFPKGGRLVLYSDAIDYSDE